MTSSTKLSDYGLSDKMGFMPSTEPSKRLPEYFAEWEAIIDNLPELISSGEIREKVKLLPLFEASSKTLPKEEDWWRAYIVTTFIGQAYIWMDENDKDIMHSIPECVAVPWCTVSKHLDMPPVVTYATACLYNWQLRDPTAPPDGDNMYSLITYTGTEDESWFYIVCLLIEIEAVPGMEAMLNAYTAIEMQDDQALAENLTKIKDSMDHMIQQLKRMRERCKPEVFFKKFRRFQRGSKNEPFLPDKMHYEGVEPETQEHCGASAAQSSTLPVFDIFLGVKHTGKNLEFLQEQRTHMPRLHRKFLEELEKKPSVQEYIEASQNPELKQKFNAIADGLTTFRSEHFRIVTSYIIHFIPGQATGTGGTELSSFLKGVRDDTQAAKLEMY